MADTRGLSIRQYEKGPWRLWAGDDFVRSFPTPEAALQAINVKSVSLPPGNWKAPADLVQWRCAERRLPPKMF